MSDPYASHIPFLSSFSTYNFTSILELGAGDHSTPLFLNTDIFPSVRRVVSVEHNPEWAARIQAKCPDSRLDLIVTPEPIEQYLETLNLAKFDLIFVDNSDCWENRVKTIEYLGENVTTSRVVIHDFEHDFYKNAARAFANKIVDESRTPNTAMVWK